MGPGIENIVFWSSKPSRLGTWYHPTAHNLTTTAHMGTRRARSYKVCTTRTALVLEVLAKDYTSQTWRQRVRSTTAYRAQLAQIQKLDDELRAWSKAASIAHRTLQYEIDPALRAELEFMVTTSEYEHAALREHIAAFGTAAQAQLTRSADWRPVVYPAPIDQAQLTFDHAGHLSRTR